MPLAKSDIENLVSIYKSKKFDELKDRKLKLAAIVKLVKEIARKEYQFKYALDLLDELEKLHGEPELKQCLSKIEDAKTEIKMDHHDHEVPVSQNVDDNIEGYFGEWGPYYLGLAIATVAAGAAYYHRYHRFIRN